MYIFSNNNYKNNINLNCHTSPETHSCHTGTSQTPAIKTLIANKLLTFLT